MLSEQQRQYHPRALHAFTDLDQAVFAKILDIIANKFLRLPAVHSKVV
jgi:hypothetical protein